MKKQDIRNTGIALLLGMSLFSCSKGFEELNVNPSKPTTTSIAASMNGIIANIQPDWSEFTFLYNELYFPLSELNGQSRRLGVDAVTRTNGALWTKYYNMMKNVRDVELIFEQYKGDAAALVNVKAVLKIVVAQVTFHMTDIFGDMPFSEGGYGFRTDHQILQPKYDTQRDIYYQLLNDLKWANDNMNLAPDAKTPSGQPLVKVTGAEDAYFGGKLESWQALANGLRLRYALRLAEKDPAKAREVAGEVLGKQLPLPDGSANRPDIISDPLKFNSTGFNLFDSYAPSGSSGVRMGSTIWHYLSATDQPDGSGIMDPRAYIWFLPNKDGRWLPYPQHNPGSALEDATDVYNRSTSTVAAPLSVYSPVNLNLLSQDNDIPRPVLTVAEVDFLLAEAYLRGIGVTKDAVKSESYYYAGIRSSIQYWYTYMNKSGGWVNRPSNPTDQQISTLLANPRIVFSGDDAQKLQLIYAQEWLSLFWQPDIAFYLFRRTGLTPHTGPVDKSFYRLRYPASEATYNKQNYEAAVSRAGGDETGVKLWWMK